MKKFIGWSLFLLSAFLLLDTFYALTDFFFVEFGFWAGLLNFALLPITYVVYPILRLFFAGTFEDIIYHLVIFGMFWGGWKLLSRKVKRIPKQTKLSTDEKDIPNLTRFEILTSLASVPFSYYMLLFGTGLTTAIGIVLAGGIYYLEASLINRVHVGIIFLIGLGVLYALFIGLYSIYISLKKSKRFDVAFLLKDEGSPLFGLVDEVADKVGVKAPDNILVSFEPDLHVHQVQSTLMDGTKIKGRTLTIGLVFLRYLSTSEIQAIVAHELAHFKGRDTLFSVYVAPAYKSLKTALANLYELTSSDSADESSDGSSNRGWMSLPNLLTVLIFSKYFYSLQKMYSSLDRVREARADIIASVLYGSNNFSDALQKVSQLGPVFKEVSQRNFLSIITEHNKVFNNYFDFFHENVYGKKEIKKLMSTISDSDKVTSEMDTHFSLKARVGYLPSNDMDVNKKSILSKTDLVKYEKRLTEMYGAYVGILTGAFNKKSEPKAKKS